MKETRDKVEPYRAGRAMLRHCATLEVGPCSIAFWTRRTSRTSSPDCNPSCFTGSFRAVDSRIAASSWRWRHPSSWRASSISTCGARPTRPGRAVRRRSFRRVARSAGGIWRHRGGAEARGDGRRSRDRRARATRARLRPRGGHRRYTTTDGRRGGPRFAACDDGLTCDVGGYLLVARRTDSWDAIVAVLMSLDAEHHDYFHQVMRGCRSLSNSRPEVDGLDDLLSDGDQVMFDLAFDREQRREKQGYVRTCAGSRVSPDVAPASARARAPCRPAIQSRAHISEPSNETTAADVHGDARPLPAGSDAPLLRSDSQRRLPQSSRYSRGGHPRAAASSAARRIAGTRAASRAHPGAHAVRARP